MDRPALDRWTLLGEKKDDLLTLPEVERYGSEHYGDADYVSLYGLRPSDWYARGVRIAGRTAVECTRDRLADLIGGDVAAVAARSAAACGPLVVDLFAGSANTLYWISRHVKADRAAGFERDGTVFALTDANLSLVGAGVELIHESYETGLPVLNLGGGGLVVFFVAPPWGRALSEEAGLDLRDTTPPVADVMRFCSQALGARPILFAVQVADRVEQDSLAQVTELLEWSALTMYDINAPGHRAGLLVGTSGWSPDA